MKRWLPILLGVMAVVAGSAEALVQLKARGIRRGHEAEMIQALETGSLQPLLRARALGQRLSAAKHEVGRGPLLLALVDVMLARSFGLATDSEAEAQIRRSKRCSGPDSDALCETVEALLSLGRGQVDVAREQAQRATRRAPGEPFPLIALAMSHARSGALAAASKVLEAVMVRDPHLVTARVVWAEIRIDLGDPETAALELESLLGRVAGHTRAALLLSEARRAMARGGPQALAAELESGCARDGRASPAVASACALDAAELARLGGQRERAVERALVAARIAPSEPRLLARIAQLLAQLGYIDMADDLVKSAVAAGGAELQTVSWARVAVTLGRGGVPAVGQTASLTGPLPRVFAARAAFVAGGASGLRELLATLGDAVAGDPELARLARLLGSDEVVPADASDPGDAYIAGMSARLAGHDRVAVEWLARALAGHGDACHAAGEYAEATRSLHRPAPPESAFAVLRATNRGCVNLPGPHAGPLPREHLRAPIR